MSDCRYCKKAYSEGFVGTCSEKNKDGFYCTREKDHKGNHVACGASRHKIAVWRKR